MIAERPFAVNNCSVKFLFDLPESVSILSFCQAVPRGVEGLKVLPETVLNGTFEVEKGAYQNRKRLIAPRLVAPFRPKSHRITEGRHLRGQPCATRISDDQSGPCSRNNIAALAHLVGPPFYATAIGVLPSGRRLCRKKRSVLRSGKLGERGNQRAPASALGHGLVA